MLARFADKGRVNAILMVVLGVMIPPVFLFGGAAVTLVSLRRGLVEGILIGAAGWSVVAGLIVVLGGTIPGSLLAMLAMLLAMAGMSGVLRQTSSLALVLLMGVGLSLLALAVVWLSLEDPVGYWRAAFTEALDQLIASGAQISVADRNELLSSLQLQAFTGNVIATLLLLTYGAVFLGRSWQAQLVNPGGFRQEFRRLQLGRSLALITAVIFMATAVLESGLLLNVAAILMWLWVLQGLSIVHAIVGGLKASSGWLVATYLGLMFGWSAGVPVALVIPILGLINQFFDVRGHVLRNSDNGE